MVPMNRGHAAVVVACPPQGFRLPSGLPGQATTCGNQALEKFEYRSPTFPE